MRGNIQSILFRSKEGIQWDEETDFLVLLKDEHMLPEIRISFGEAQPDVWFR